MIFADSEAQPDLSQEERDILKLVVRELAEKIIRKCDKNSDDGL
jgi:FixJ family two-component response regulator